MATLFMFIPIEKSNMQSLNTILKEVGEEFEKIVGETILVKEENWATKTKDNLKSFLLKEVEKSFKAGQEAGPDMNTYVGK